MRSRPTAPPSRPWPGQVLQLAAYALLLEERHGRPVTRGYLHYLEGDVVREQPIDEADKQAVRDIVAEVQALVTSETMPSRAPASHCRDCVYAKICV